MSRRLLCPLIAAIALVLFWSAPTEAQTARTFTLRLNHVLAPTEPYHQGFQTWAKRVDERTKGGLKIQVFHSAQLGVEEDIIEQMRQGATIGQNTDAARLGNYVKAIDGVELVYNNIPGGRFYEVLKHANETKHIMLINFQVVGSKFFDSLPAEYQTVLVEECKRAERETSEKMLASEQAVKQQLKGRGMTINEDVDLAAFRKAGEAAYEKL